MKSSVVAACFVLSFGLVALVYAQRPTTPSMEVFKSPTCGCCSKWVEYARQAGFAVKVTDLDDDALDAVKTKNGVPRTAQSCHTALVGGFVVEGHVPLAEVHRLLKEKPAVIGIAVAGMPTGSPGMEVPGGRVQPYNVISFDKQGNTKVFASFK
jgi:hypothetical protein